MAELTGAQLVRRAYDRFGFGATSAELQAGAANPERAIADLLAGLALTSDAGVTATPPPDLRAAERDAASDVPRKQLEPEERRALKRGRRDRQRQLVDWWLTRMVLAEHPAAERLTWFWHGHFATSIQKVKSASLMLDQNETLRRLGRRTFRPLAAALVVDPALLVWLDGNDNMAGKPNENLSREFLELFSLGHGNYDETDVREAARALTGWKVSRATGEARFVERRHDAEVKQIFGRSDRFDAATFVGLVCDQPASAQFVVRRLWFRLVSPDAPDAATLERLVAAFGVDGDVPATLAALSREPAFRDSASSLVKQPVEWAVGLLRALQVTPADLPERQRTRLIALLRGMGQVPFLPPSVGGWPAGSSWLTTASALSRTEAASMLSTAADLRKSKVSRRSVPDHVAELLGLDRLSDRTRTAVAAVADSLPDAVAVAACAPEYVVSR